MLENYKETDLVNQSKHSQIVLWDLSLGFPQVKERVQGI